MIIMIFEELGLGLRSKARIKLYDAPGVLKYSLS